MLRIDQAPEPVSFKTSVEIPGDAWLQAHPTRQADEKMPDYWKACAKDLFEAYHGICAFTLMRIKKAHGKEMDHFRPKSLPRYRNLAYKWTNFRLVSPRINKKKWAHLLADPFKIPKDGFYIDFSDGRIQVNPRWQKSPVVSKLLQKTRDQLALNDEGLPEGRKEAYDDYMNQDPQYHSGICVVVRECPFVAYEMLRQGWLRAEDRDICRNILKSIGFSWITA